MVNEFKSWLTDNSTVLEGLMEVTKALPEGASVLALGSFSLIPSMLVAEEVKCAHIDALFKDDELSDDFFENTDDMHIVRRVDEAKAGTYDLIYGLFYLNSIKKSQVVPMLFTLSEALRKGGRMLLVAEDCLQIEVGEGREEAAWYNSDEKLFWKRYTLSDLVQTLSLLGLRINAVEEVKAEGMAHAVAITAQSV